MGNDKRIEIYDYILNPERLPEYCYVEENNKLYVSYKGSPGYYKTSINKDAKDIINQRNKVTPEMEDAFKLGASKYWGNEDALETLKEEVEQITSDTIKVRYYASQPEKYITIFKEIDKEKYYNRFDKTIMKTLWHTCSDPHGYAETGFPISENTQIEVYDYDNKLLYVESNKDGDNKFDSLRELKDRKTKEWQTKKKVISKESWEKEMLEDMRKFGYDGYELNFLYHENEIVDINTLENVKHLGLSIDVEEYQYRHKITGKTWSDINVEVKSIDNESEVGKLSYEPNPDAKLHRNSVINKTKESEIEV